MKPAYLHIFLLIALLSSACKKNKQEEPAPPITPNKNLEITGYYPQEVFVNDTVTIKGNFVTENVKELTISCFIDRDRAITFPTLTPINTSATELVFVMPAFESTRYSEELTINIQISTGDTTYYGFVTDSMKYVMYPPRASFWPSKVYAGQTILLQSSFDEAERDNIKIRFSGTTEWINPVGWDTMSYEWSERGMAYRVPANAKDGPIEMWSPGRKARASDTSLKIYPQMPPLQKGIWVRRANFAEKSITNDDVTGGGRADVAAFAVGNKAYIVGGTSLAPFDDYGSDILWEYDAESNTWLQKAMLPAGNRVICTGFAIGDKGYVTLGVDKNKQLQKDLWEYDTKTDTWHQKANFPGAARRNAVSFVIGNKAYVGGGTDGTTAFNDFYAYDPATNTWSAIASLPEGTSRAFAFAANGNGYVGGGQNLNGPLATMHVYNPGTNAWVAKSSLPGTYAFVTQNAAVGLNGKGYVGLGSDPGQSVSIGTNTVWEYNVATDSWQQIPAMGTELRFGAIGFTIKNAIYMGLGASPGGLGAPRDIWGYIP